MWVRGEVVGYLMMLRGGEDIRGGRDAEVGADVAEDDGVKHDVFVCSVGVGNLWHGKSDALGEGWSWMAASRLVTVLASA